MKAARARQPLCAFALFALPVLQAGAAEWSAQSTAQILALTETNPRLASGGAPDAQAGVVDLALKLSRSTELTDVAIDAHGAIRRYTRDVALDRDDQQVILALRRRGERYLLVGEFTAARDTTLTSELGTTGIIQDNQRHDSLTASFGPTFQLTERTTAATTAGWQRSRYARTLNSPLVNYDYLTAGLNAAHDFSEKGSLGLGASAGKLNSSGPGFDINNIDVRMRAEYRWSDRWRGALSAGVSQVRTAGRRQNGSVYSASMTRQAERYSLDANVSRSVAPTGRGLLSRRDEAGLQLNARLLEHLDGGASFSLVRSRDYVPQFGFSINDVRYTRAELSLNWWFAREWTLGLSGGRSEQQLIFNDLSGRNLSAWLRIGWRRASPVG